MAHMLITVQEREICTQQFDSFEEARAQMMDELGSEFAREYVNGGFCTLEDWEKIAAQSKYVDQCDEFAFGNTWAWSNLDSDYNFDWKIVELS